MDISLFHSRVLAEGIEGLRMQIVLDLAGVFLSDLGIDADGNEEVGEDLMARVDLLSDLHTLIGQCDQAVAGHGDITVFAEILGSVGYAGLGHAKVLSDVYGTDVAVVFLKDEHGFQIVFRGFIDLHFLHLFTFLTLIQD